MSGTRDDYENAGGDHPDKGGTWSGPVPDDDVTQAGTQNGPIEDMHATSVQEQLEGIVVQTRADLALHGEQDVEKLVRHRLEDAGMNPSDADVARVVAEVGETDDGSRIQPGVHPDR